MCLLTKGGKRKIKADLPFHLSFKGPVFVLSFFGNCGMLQDGRIFSVAFSYLQDPFVSGVILGNCACGWWREGSLENSDGRVPIAEDDWSPVILKNQLWVRTVENTSVWGEPHWCPLYIEPVISQSVVGQSQSNHFCFQLLYLNHTDPDLCPFSGVYVKFTRLLGRKFYTASSSLVKKISLCQSFSGSGIFNFYDYKATAFGV